MFRSRKVLLALGCALFAHVAQASQAAEILFRKRVKKITKDCIRYNYTTEEEIREACEEYCGEKEKLNELYRYMLQKMGVKPRHPEKRLGEGICSTGNRNTRTRSYENPRSRVPPIHSSHRGSRRNEKRRGSNNLPRTSLHVNTAARNVSQNALNTHFVRKKARNVNVTSMPREPRTSTSDSEINHTKKAKTQRSRDAMQSRRSDNGEESLTMSELYHIDQTLLARTGSTMPDRSKEITDERRRRSRLRSQRKKEAAKSTTMSCTNGEPQKHEVETKLRIRKLGASAGGHEGTTEYYNTLRR